MIEFRCHQSFEKEIALLEKKKLRYIRNSLKGFEKLCGFYFHPTSPEKRIAPGKLHRVSQNDAWTMWKTELPVIKSGLCPNQYPRIWFAQSGATIVFLCISSHTENYKNEELDALALSRVSDFF